ncbi:hypothetical protein [Arthrobacter sp. SLBN-112]|jgi:hypothetical protein|nr:hypothetical protein [Arthrobacter sp. SLBN-112]
MMAAPATMTDNARCSHGHTRNPCLDAGREAIMRVLLERVIRQSLGGVDV